MWRRRLLAEQAANEFSVCQFSSARAIVAARPRLNWRARF